MLSADARLPDLIMIKNTRVLPVDRERLFRAFSSPAQLAEWWGPNGCTNRILAFDFRAGGEWRVVMRVGEGEFENRYRFVVIVPPEKVVLEHVEPVHRFTLAMDYRALDARRTELTWTMQLEPSETHEKLRSFIQAANEQNLDRLAAWLARDAPA